MTALEPPRWRGRWVLYLAGIGVAAVGVVGILRNEHGYTPPVAVATWLLGGIAGHDAVMAPLAFLLAWLIGRRLPMPARAPLGAALLTSASLALIAYPLVRGFGRSADLPSALPQDYATGLMVFLALVWSAAALVALFRVRRARPDA